MSVWQAVLVVVVAECAGAVTGALVAVHLLTRNRGRYLPRDSFREADLEPRITAAAQAWAEEHGRPGMASSVAEKLRLAGRFQARRSGRWPE